MEVKRKIGGSVKLEVEYLMIEKLKDKNKNAQQFVLLCTAYHGINSWPKSGL